jgi:hypothetical protein
MQRRTPGGRGLEVSAVERLGTIAARRQATPGQVAFAWLLARKPWIVPIPGTTRLHRPEENIVAAAIERTPVDLREIETVLSTIPVLGDRCPERLERTPGRSRPVLDGTGSDTLGGDCQCQGAVRGPG